MVGTINESMQNMKIGAKETAQSAKQGIKNAGQSSSKTARDVMGNPVPGSYTAGNTANDGDSSYASSKNPSGNADIGATSSERTAYAAPQRAAVDTSNVSPPSTQTGGYASKDTTSTYEGAQPLSSQSSRSSNYTNVKITATQNNVDALTGAPIRIVTTTNARIQPDEKTLQDLLEQRQVALREAREAEEELQRARQYNDRSTSEALELEARAKKAAQDAELASERAREAQSSIERSASLREKQAREEAERAATALREAELKHRLAQANADVDVANSKLDIALKNEAAWKAERESSLAHQKAVIDSARAELERARHEAAVADATYKKEHYEYNALVAELEERNDNTLRTASIREAEARNLEVHMEDTLKDARMRSRNATEQVEVVKREINSEIDVYRSSVEKTKAELASYQKGLPSQKEACDRELDDATRALQAAQDRFNAAKLRVNQFDVDSRQQLAMLTKKVRDAEDAEEKYRISCHQREEEITRCATQAYDAVKAAEKRNETIAEAARAKENEAKDLYSKAESITQDLNAKRSHPPQPANLDYSSAIQRAQERLTLEESKLTDLRTAEPSQYVNDVEVARRALRDAQAEQSKVESEYNSVKGSKLYTTEPVHPHAVTTNEPTDVSTKSKSAAYHYPATTETVSSKAARSATTPAYVGGATKTPSTTKAVESTPSTLPTSASTNAAATTTTKKPKAAKSTAVRDDVSSASSDSDKGTTGLGKSESKSSRKERRSSTSSGHGLMNNVRHALGMSNK
nr:RecName: Full=Protein lsd90; AltName: Full=90kDa large and small daughter protein [Schizosaccharomyces pombe 972h-]BAF98920.1 lsd p90 [Schizosaccharomyces pombe]